MILWESQERIMKLAYYAASSVAITMKPASYFRDKTNGKWVSKDLNACNINLLRVEIGVRFFHLEV